MKKGDAAAAAEQRMTDSGWLPEVLRNREVPERIAYGRWDDDANEEPDGEAEADADTDQTGDTTPDGEADGTETA